MRKNSLAHVEALVDSMRMASFSSGVSALQAAARAAMAPTIARLPAKGLDPIIAYLTGQEYRPLVNDQIANFVPTDLQIVPLEALTRIQTLLDSQVLTKIIGLLKMIPARGGTEAMLLVALNNVVQELLSFRKELLKAVPTKVNNKNYVLDASGTRGRLDTIYNDLRSFAKQSHL